MRSGLCAAGRIALSARCRWLLLLLACRLPIIALKKHRAEACHHNGLHEGEHPVGREGAQLCSWNNATQLLALRRHCRQPRQAKYDPPATSAIRSLHPASHPSRLQRPRLPAPWSVATPPQRPGTHLRVPGQVHDGGRPLATCIHISGVQLLALGRGLVHAGRQDQQRAWADGQGGRFGGVVR